MLLANFDWEHAFIREAHLVSPSYVTPDGITVAPDYLPRLRVLVVTPERDSPGLEFVFDEVEMLSLPLACDLQPSLQHGRDWVEMRLDGEGMFVIRARAVHIRRCDEDCWGDHLRYGVPDDRD